LVSFSAVFRQDYGLPDGNIIRFLVHPRWSSTQLYFEAYSICDRTRIQPGVPGDLTGIAGNYTGLANNVPALGHYYKSANTIMGFHNDDIVGANANQIPPKYVLSNFGTVAAHLTIAAGLTGHIQEIVVYNRTLSPEEYHLQYAQLICKWGISGARMTADVCNAVLNGVYPTNTYGVRG
jgi:hypothetical protein